MAKLYGVSPGGYHAWRNRPESQREIDDKALLVDVRRLFVKYKGRYGSPRVHDQLIKEGFIVGKRRIERIMRENGIRAVAENKPKAKPWKITQYSDAENRIKDVELTGINQVWLTDVTYLKINGKQLYLATVLDKYSRKILSWSIGPKKSCRLTKRVLKRAYKLRKPKINPIIHSDRGSEFLGDEYRALVKKLKLTPSVNRPRSMNDNAHMESWYKTMKTEMYYRGRFRTFSSLRRAVYDYINFYNTIRSHSSLGYQSPCDYELSYAN